MKLNFFKKKSKKVADDKLAVLTMLDLFYLDSDNSFKDLDLYIRFRISLFTYGVLDGFCQAKNFSKDEADVFLDSLEDDIRSRINFSISYMRKKNRIEKIFTDKFLLDIITAGGQSYNDFLSNDNKKGSMAMRRLNSLIGFWFDIPITDLEEKLLS